MKSVTIRRRRIDLEASCCGNKMLLTLPRPRIASNALLK